MHIASESSLEAVIRPNGWVETYHSQGIDISPSRYFSMGRLWCHVYACSHNGGGVDDAGVALLLLLGEEPGHPKVSQLPPPGLCQKNIGTARGNYRTDNLEFKTPWRFI